MKELTCIVCPRGCRLMVDEEHDFKVTGNHCPRGAAYGANELRHPTRVLASTVAISGATCDRLPVKTNAPIGKELLLQAMEIIHQVQVTSPVSTGQVIVANILGSGVDVVATRDL
jgi:CxxC motif-containing protein